MIDFMNSNLPTTPTELPHRLNRRTALATTGARGLGAVLAACGAGTTKTASSTWATNSTGTSTNSTATTAVETAATSCTLTPEMTQGPYYLDLDLVRRDITDSRAGAPLTLNLQVVGATTCAPIEGATVDIWHADADGLYSGFVSSSASANGGGQVTFEALYPGLVPGPHRARPRDGACLGLDRPHRSAVVRRHLHPHRLRLDRPVLVTIRT